MYVVKTNATYVAKPMALINCVFIVQLIFAFFRICKNMFSFDAALIIIWNKSKRNHTELCATQMPQHQQRGWSYRI